ncbi:hypothetical protein K503DRAFT_794650 [Rhizopogon vinicolor AM-OR11-026]|uniref:Nucleolar protein 58/56 N-terminal domain-containing protein n=1 Tax=Rhizopogon vinicolor AM-OR11-026 TaxID=1314800 RepID=A0A1B7MJV4_9AGAM|nr:hypothetical protein K503DRAFT_794650 [Rhizopogon vinicolor AM-OR11-026]
MVTHALFNSASGYAVFDVKLHENIGSRIKSIQDSIDDLSKWSRLSALENINDISEGIVNEHLKSLLELNLSKPKKGSNTILAASAATLAWSISDALGIQCDA